MKKIRVDKKILLTLTRRRNSSDRHFKESRERRRKSLLGVPKGSRLKTLDRLKSVKKNSKLKRVFAPTDFSFNDNTSAVVEFISNIEQLYKDGEGVFVDLKSVEKIDYGSIVSLLSILAQFTRKKININGNFPKSYSCAKILRESGFIYNLFRPKNDGERYCISNGEDNSIVTHGWKKVDSALSAEIIKQSSRTIWGDAKRCQGVQRCIGELMLNTNNHAKLGEKGAMNWWLYVNHDNEKKVVSFAFVDFGIGIFESLKNKPIESRFYQWYEKLKGLALKHDNAKVLEMIMSGDFHRTVTGKYYRGKGLPGISEAHNRNQLSNLLIVSNNTVGNVTLGSYQSIDAWFSGTYIYWELNSKYEYCE